LMRALRLEMLADTPIGYAETLADAQSRPLEKWADRAAGQASGCEQTRYIAECGGRFVATAGGLADGPRTAIVGVYVAPALRGTGLLARVLQPVAAWSTGCGRAEVYLDVAVENPRAIAAYTRLGFVPTGISKPHQVYPDITEIELARSAVWPAAAVD
jgi:predicted GNAT family acetyltransferase